MRESVFQMGDLMQKETSFHCQLAAGIAEGCDGYFLEINCIFFEEWKDHDL